MNRTIKLSISGLVGFLIWGLSGFFALPTHLASIVWFGLALPFLLVLIIYVAHHEGRK